MLALMQSHRWKGNLKVIETRKLDQFAHLRLFWWHLLVCISIRHLAAYSTKCSSRPISHQGGKFMREVASIPRNKYDIRVKQLQKLRRQRSAGEPLAAQLKEKSTSTLNLHPLTCEEKWLFYPSLIKSSNHICVQWKRLHLLLLPFYCSGTTELFYVLWDVERLASLRSIEKRQTLNHWVLESLWKGCTKLRRTIQVSASKGLPLRISEGMERSQFHLS